MNNQNWQLNPSLSIRPGPENESLEMGHLSPYALKVETMAAELIELCRWMKNRPSFSRESFITRANDLGFEGSAVFEQMREQNILISPIERGERYSRHRLYYSFFGLVPKSLDILGAKSVLLLGVGGIGSTCAMQLAAAGIGTLILVDPDLVEESNLTRATLFEESDIGRLKVEAAKERIQARSLRTSVISVPLELASPPHPSVVDAFSKTDFVILSGDSGPEVHQMSYALAKSFSRPYMNAGYVETFGVVGPITIGDSAWRDRELFAARREKEINEGLAAPSFGPLNALVSSIAVNEVLRYFLDLPGEAMGARLVIDSATYQIHKEEWR